MRKIRGGANYASKYGNYKCVICCKMVWWLELHGIVCFDIDGIVWLVSLLREHVRIHPWQIPVLWGIALDRRVLQPEELRQRIWRVLQPEELRQRIRRVLQPEELRQRIGGALQPEEFYQQLPISIRTHHNPIDHINISLRHFFCQADKNIHLSFQRLHLRSKKRLIFLWRLPFTL